MLGGRNEDPRPRAPGRGRTGASPALAAAARGCGLLGGARCPARWGAGPRPPACSGGREVSRRGQRGARRGEIGKPAWPAMVVAAEGGRVPESAEAVLHPDQLGPVDGGSKSVPGQCLADFELVSELGRGTYGVVHKVRSKKDGKIYCLKKVKCGRLSPQRQREVLMEVLMLRRLSHKHVIGYYTSFVEKKSLYIVMEFASNGDLQRVLDEHKRNKTYVPEKLLWRVVYELAQALEHLHSKRIIHRDIKIVNVFLDENNSVKLGDLGVSRALDGEDELAQSRVGTPLYLAPELIKRQPYDYKADIWALGVLIYHLAALKAPFSGDNIYALGSLLAASFSF